MDAGPGWCFDRFGQSSTLLKDGSVVLIAGEHEDHYDPDFYIYNDVVVQHSDGKVDIFGYPKEIFPPTDFHSATLSGDQIILIGSLGYPKERAPKITPVVALDLNTYAISKIVTSGSAPGWIHKHKAILSQDGRSILIQDGKLDRGSNESLIENIDDWELNLADWHWKRLTKRQWQQWQIMRADGKPNRLWEIRQALWHRGVHWEKEFREQMEQLTREYTVEPNLDIAPTLYHPSIPHEAMPDVEGEFQISRIKVDGIIVRYVEGMHSIQMTVEGDLLQRLIDHLVSDLVAKMGILENTRYEMKRL